MRAVTYRVGGPAAEVLAVEEVGLPVPGPGEVRVAIHYSGINPTDVRARAAADDLAGEGFRIPHQDGSGIVDAVGSGVDEGLLGRLAWVFHAALGQPHGTAAEAVCLPVDRVVPLPTDVDPIVGACLGVPYLTAHLCAFDGEVGAPTARHVDHGDNVLVTGGAGAVGAAAVQLLRWAGARVIATASTDQKAEAALAAGAEHVVRYREEPVVQRLREIAPDGLTRVVDVALAENLSTYAEELAPGAVVAAYAGGATRPEVPMRAFMRRNASLRFVHVYGARPERLAAAVRDITAALEAGALAPVATRVLPIERVVEAHEAVESGAFGRVLIGLPSSDA